MNTDDIIDVVVTILILALFVPIMIGQTVPLLRGTLGGFDVQIEKTALPTRGEIAPIKNSFTSHDAILMLVVADDYFPDPRVVEINGTTINIDAAFLGNRVGALQQAAAAMPTVKDMQYELYVGPTGKRKWVFIDE